MIIIPFNNNKVKRKNKTTVIISGSMLHCQRPKFLSKHNNAYVRFHPGTITKDTVDFIKLAIQKHPDAIIIYPGTKDLTNGTNTMKQVCKTAKTTQEMEDDHKMGISFSSVKERINQNFKYQIKETNDKLKKYCKSNGFVYVDNDNIN